MSAIRSLRSGFATLSQMDLFAPATSTIATSETCFPQSSTATPSATSSPASGSGLWPFAWPAGLTIARCGPDPAHASLSARQATASGLLTSDTFGPSGTGSSSSASLALSLANRLRNAQAQRGSILYQLTWKAWATPAGRSISLLRATVRRTSGSDCSGWPTPDAALMNDGCNPVKHLERLARLKAKHGNGNGAGLTLGAAAQMAGWATPATRDYRTPNHRTLRERGGGAKGEQLQNQVAHLIPGASLNGLTASTGGSGLLNPAFSRWLQGIPEAWDACAPTATPSTRGRRLK